MEDKIGLVLGAVLTILGAFGILKPDESTALATYGSSFIISGIGIYEVVKAIVKRYRQKKTEEEKKN